MANSIIHPDTGAVLEYEQLIKDPLFRKEWLTSSANEFGRLTNGVGDRMPSGTNTMFFIKKSDVPRHKTVTYAIFVCDHRPQKEETRRTRLVVGGNLVIYNGEVSTPTADLTTAKILFNSVLSTTEAKFLGLDVKDFYLNTIMTEFEYIKIPIKLIPQEIIDQYGLLELVASDGCVYIEVRKGMYGLPQAGILAHKQLVQHLKPFG